MWHWDKIRIATMRLVHGNDVATYLGIPLPQWYFYGAKCDGSSTDGLQPYPVRFDTSVAVAHGLKRLWFNISPSLLPWVSWHTRQTWYIPRDFFSQSPLVIVWWIWLRTEYENSSSICNPLRTISADKLSTGLPWDISQNQMIGTRGWRTWHNFPTKQKMSSEYPYTQH